MSNHNFNFEGGDILRVIGASWFISYTYYKKLDSTHKNWENVSTVSSRISNYNKSEAYHTLWLNEILKMNTDKLSTNTLNLKVSEIFSMTKAILATLSE